MAALDSLMEDLRLPLWYRNREHVSDVDKFDSVEDAGMNLEWLNTDHEHRFPNLGLDWADLFDNDGRRVYMKIEFGKVLDAKLLSRQPSADDLAALKAIQTAYERMIAERENHPLRKLRRRIAKWFGAKNA
jgi:hypothetical protein